MTLKSPRLRSPSRLRWFCPTVAALFIASLPAMGQEGTAPVDEATPWTHQDFANCPKDFRFAIVSDRAANPRQGVFPAALAKLELLRPEFVLSVGDFIHGYDEERKPETNEELLRKKRRGIDEGLEALTMPFYRVAGNHDFNNDPSARIWKELYGPDYYAFVYQDVLFLCLNSQDGRDYRTGIGEEQITWAKDTLAKHGDARWVFLFFHQPLWLEDERRTANAKDATAKIQLTGFHEIEKLLENRNYTVFAGHHHRYGKWVKNGQKYIRLATTGGQSDLAGPEAGQFDHVTWVTMTDQGPVLCHLLLEGILDEDGKPKMPLPTAQE